MHLPVSFEPLTDQKQCAHDLHDEGGRGINRRHNQNIRLFIKHGNMKYGTLT